MTAKTKRTPTHATDTQGREIVLVPLANQAAPVRILKADFDALIAAGWSDQWKLNDSGNGYAYVKVPETGTCGRHAIVARLLMQPGRREQVCYRDGNRTNLIRSNLYPIADPRGRKGKTPVAKLANDAYRFAKAAARLA